MLLVSDKAENADQVRRPALPSVCPRREPRVLSVRVTRGVADGADGGVAASRTAAILARVSMAGPWGHLRSFVLLSLVCTALLAQIGCAAALRQAATEATPALVGGGVEGGSEALGTDEVQRDLSRLLADKELRAAIGGMMGAMVGSAVDALTNEERAARQRQMGAQFVDALGRASARVLQRDLSPAMATAAAAAVDAVLTASLAEPHVADLDTMVSRLLGSAIGAMAIGLRQDIAPAMNDVMNDPAVSRAMGTLSYEVSRGIMLGSDAAIKEISARNTDNRESASWLQWLRGSMATSVSAVVILLVPLAIALAIVVAMLVRAMRERQRMEVEGSRRDVAMMQLLTELSIQSGASDELRARIDNLKDLTSRKT